jgi:hypothetical protein
MRAIEAKTFSGYGGLQQIELSKPSPAEDSEAGEALRHLIEDRPFGKVVVAW